MAKFKCTVYREDQYEIEIDDNLINEDYLEAFREVFWDAYDLEDLAEHLAQFQARIAPADGFFEGFGYVKINNQFRNPKKAKPSPEFSIKVIEEDSCRVEVLPIEEKEESCTHQ
jgi:hypothetical protein